MNTTEQYKQLLQKELTEITADLQSIATLNALTGDWVAIPVSGAVGDADENVAADTTEEWNERRALVAQLEIRYRNVHRALDKIETGTYGICEISGEPIEPERLNANPAARTNIANRDRERELPL